MAEKTLYFIRHGQSEANLAGAHAGWAQVSLTAKGYEDARLAGERIRRAGLTFDKVYTSDLIRAVQTKETALPELPSEPSPLIREVNVGTLAGRLVANCKKEYGAPYLRAKQDMDFTAWGGENYSAFCDRIRQFFADILNGDGDRIAAFCHGGMIHASLDLLIGGELSDPSLPSPESNRIDKSAFSCDNCGITVFAFRGGKWRLGMWNWGK
ncbi:MAG: histidine phosphatase family protein [Clostridia bacterium]|nr:histidine phosphatase family protein [Clostridia bacterium]